MSNNEEQPVAATNDNTGANDGSDGEEKKAKEITIPDQVAGLLDDISTSAPAGENPEATEDQELMVSYMNLETEMSKLSDNDYGQCVESATELLHEKSKHLRIAVWLLIAWYRTEHLTGLRNGLLLILELLKKYKDTLYPDKPKQRSKIIQSLATESRLKTLQKAEVTSSDTELIKEIGKIYSELTKVCNEQFAETPPKLTQLSTIIEDKVKETNKSQAKPAKKPEPKKTSTEQKEKKDQTAKKETPEPRSTPAAGESGSVAGLRIGNEKDAMNTLKRSILFFFENSNNGNQGIPKDASVYAMSRLLRWGKINTIPNKDNITQIDAPNQPKQDYITKLVNNKDIDTLVPEIEINFLNKDEFLYWFDTQRYVVEALEVRGGETAKAAEEIKIQLSRLIQKIPSLPDMKFSNKKMPFASPETKNWIEDEVKGVFGGGQKAGPIVPPVFGEEYDSINEEYKRVCDELPENFEENAKKIQGSVRADPRPKGRFLRLLSLANYCNAAKQYKLASVLLNDLVDRIHAYNIIDWEQALCVSVWQSLYLNNQKLMNTELPQERLDELGKQQEELYYLIGKYDSVRALKLTNHE